MLHFVSCDKYLSFALMSSLVPRATGF